MARKVRTHGITTYIRHDWYGWQSTADGSPPPYDVAVRWEKEYQRENVIETRRDTVSRFVRALLDRLRG